MIVVVNDNSTGNDKIICDGWINTIKNMAGKTVAAKAGVVDHFLLVQGLESAGMTEDDASTSVACSPTLRRPVSPAGRSTS